MMSNINMVVKNSARKALQFAKNLRQERMPSVTNVQIPNSTLDTEYVPKQQLSDSEVRAAEEIRLKALIKELELHLMEENNYKTILGELPNKLAALDLKRKIIREQIHQHRKNITSLFHKIKSAADFSFDVDPSLYQESDENKPIALTISSLLHTIELPSQGTDSSFLDEQIIEQRASNLTVAQFSIIGAIINRLQQDINNLKSPADKKRLLELKDEQTELLSSLVAQLKHDNIDFTIDESKRLLSLQNLKMILSKEIEINTTQQPKLEELHKQFTNYLETKKLRKEQRELFQRELETSNALELCDKKITALALTEDKQAELIETFNTSEDPAKLIADYRTKIDSAMNVLGWAGSFIQDRANYTKTQKENILRATFLTLYRDQQEKKKLKEDLLIQLKSYDELIDSESDEIAEEKKYIKRVSDLLNKLSWSKISDSFPSLPTTNDYYNLLSDHRLLMQPKIDACTALVARINVLIPIITEIEEIRGTHNLPENQDNLLRPLGEYIDALDLGVLEKQKSLAEQYNNYTNGADGINAQLDKLILALKEVKQIEQQQIELTKLIHTEEVSINEIANQQGNLRFQQRVLGHALQQKSEIQHTATFATQISGCKQALASLQNIEENNTDRTINNDTETIVAVNTPILLKDSAPCVSNKADASIPIVQSTDRLLESKIVLISEPIDVQNNDSSHNSPLDRSEIIEHPIDEYLMPQIVDTNVNLNEASNLLANPAAKNFSSKVHAIVSDLPPIELIKDEASDHSVSIEPEVINTIALAIKNEHPAEDMVLIVDNLLFDEVQAPAVLNMQKRNISEPPKILVARDEQDKGTVNNNLAQENPPDEIENTEKKSRPIPAPEQKQLEHWHHANMALLEQHPDELKNWYMALYCMSEQVWQKTHDANQYAHLIHDIFFELAYKRDVEVINAYKKVCPNPQEMLGNLLRLKPDHLVMKPPFSQIEVDAWPKQLQALYGHYLKLKSVHSIKAELLLQAIQSLHGAYQARCANPAAEIDLPIMQDPRYEPLKRHRGLGGKIWALIEDFCRFIMGKLTGKVEQEYVKRPGFFNTRSIALIEQADLFIKAPLVGLSSHG